MIPALEFALGALARAINRALDLDPASKSALAKLSGRSLAMGSRLPPVSIRADLLDDGAVTLTPDQGEAVTVRLTGSPLALALLLARAGDTTTFSGSGVAIDGDQGMLQALSAVLGNLELDWEQALSGVIGDTPAHLAGEAVRSALKWNSEAIRRSATGVGDFLREESGVTLGNCEAREWFDGVRLLAADTERMAARINKLNLLLDQRDAKESKA